MFNSTIRIIPPDYNSLVTRIKRVATAHVLADTDIFMYAKYNFIYPFNKAIDSKISIESKVYDYHNIVTVTAKTN